MSSSLKVFCQQQEMVVSVPTLTDFQAWQLSLNIHYRPYRPFRVKVVRGSSNLPGVCRYEIPGVFQGVEPLHGSSLQVWAGVEAQCLYHKR